MCELCAFGGCRMRAWLGTEIALAVSGLDLPSNRGYRSLGAKTYFCPSWSRVINPSFVESSQQAM